MSNHRPLKAEILFAGENSYTVIIDGKSMCDGLCEDEALGAIAAFVYRPYKIPYVGDPVAKARFEAECSGSKGALSVTLEES